jgi:hypothetical protein
MDKRTVEIHCYVDQLIDNTDGQFDLLSSAWFIVPEEWALEQAQAQGYTGLKEFFNEYTYDTTDGWLRHAIKEGVLLGCGTGVETASVPITEWS